MTTEEFTLDSVPHKPKNITTKEFPSGLYLLLDPDTPNWIVVNGIGRDIIELCDGEKPLGKIIKVLCENYGEPYEESVEDVLAFANELNGKYFLLEEEFPPPRGADRKDAPFQNLWIHVTNKCNLRCKHCHLSSGASFQDELTTEEIFSIVSQAEQLGVKLLVVTGGEPLVREDILDILNYASEHIDRVLLLTNGTLITDEIAEKLKEFKVDVQVSLDGAQQETQDFIRGKGS
jgi:sulfatase maturation enzyme AslB (radical SAM superfamily)